jgi:hypothetical protein
MANAKLSSLTALVSPASGDKLYIVDVSDTTQSASGTSKQITYGNLVSLTALGITASVAELNILDGATLDVAELNILDGVTSTAAELNILDGATLTVTELNYVDGVTSAIQTQINAKAPIASPTFTGTVTLPTALSGIAKLTSGVVSAVTAPSGTIVGTTDTQTLTNKRVTKRVTTIVSHATPTVDTDDCDMVTITALAAAITNMTTNLSGTPTNFQTLIFRILDNGTGRAITWGTSFQAMGVALPTTTTASKVLTVGFIYDTVDSKWGCVAVTDEA